MAARKTAQRHTGKTKDGGNSSEKGAGGNGSGGGKNFFGKLALDIFVRVVANAVSDSLGFGNEDFDIQPQDGPDDDGPDDDGTDDDGPDDDGPDDDGPDDEADDGDIA